MKPLKVKMCAFGSYGSEQTIELSDIEQNIFLVTGDTGSGKSTIFDAIVFALYGEAASADSGKKGEMMHSHFAVKNVTPYVELTFSEGSDIYVVRREPRHFEYKKNGEIKSTAESEKVSLIMPDGTEYPTKETNAKLVELVGLTKAQFMQVAMIAQGEFMQILKESTNDKKVVFRKLFHTEVYEAIVNELYGRLKEKQSEIDKIQISCQQIIRGVEIPADYTDYAEIFGMKTELLGAKLSISVLDDFLKALSKLVSELEAREVKALDEYNKCDSEYLAKSKELESAENLKGKFIKLRNAEAKLLECKEKEASIEADKKLIDDIKRAYLIKVESDKCTVALKNLEDEKSAKKQNEERLPELESVEKKLKTELDAATESREAANTNYRLVKERVDKALTSLLQVAQLEKENAECKRKLENAEKAVNLANSEKEDLDKKEQNWKQRRDELDGADGRLAECEAKKKQADVIETDYTKLCKMSDEVKAQSKILLEAQQAFEQAQARYESANDEYETKNKLYLANQAGILAKTLEEGKPCPVCGSVEHPYPASIIQEAGNLTSEIIDDLRRNAEAANVTRNECAANAQTAGTLLTEKQNRFEAAKKDLIDKVVALSAGKVSETSELNEIGFEIVQISEAVSAELEIAKKNADELSTLKTNLVGIESVKKDIAKKLDAANADYVKANKEAASKKAEYETQMKGLEYQDEKAARTELKTAEESLQKNQTAYDSSKKNYDKAVADLTTCKANIDTSEKKIPELKAEIEKLKEIYDATLKTQHMSETEWKTIVSNHSQDVSEYEKRINEYTKVKIAAQTTFDDTIKEINGQAEPVIESLVEEVERIKALRQEKADLKDAVKTDKDKDKTAYDDLVKGLADRGEIMKEYNVLSRVYETLDGKVKGAKMDIETFAQRYYLECILEAANERFYGMTGGQFELRTCSIERAGEGKNRGLDLMIYSNITGKEREVSTLSGGEKFMAALALALGMADEIQAKSSAVNLDILFIDEGFGTLSENSRNEAVKVLKNMAGGEKLIGIISHVTELKQQIDDILEVSKDEKGSHAMWKKG